MKTRYNILYISVLFLTGMTACAKEDTLTPEVDTNIDCFAPAADAMDEESVLRRTFFEQENCYLLFSDTLRREELGKDSNGDMQYFIELLDVNYSVGASTNSSLTNCCRAWKRRSKRPPFCKSMYCLTCPRP